MNYNFKHETWFIHEFTENWGPFSFPCADLLPSGAAISSATVRSFNKDSNVETTTVLIEAASTVISNGTTISVNWQWPGSAHIGYHRVLIEVTLINDSEKHSFNFGFVVVE